MCQRKYALEVLADLGILAAKPAKTPMDPKLRLNGTDDELLEDPNAYRTCGKAIVFNHHKAIYFLYCEFS